MKNKIITLLTDFGTIDPYVSIMKGVILSINPNVNIIDISHNVPKFDIVKGAFILFNSGRYFPEGTIHVIVIDPGVGSERLPILIKTKRYYLIGPDNGVLSLLAYKDGIEKIYTLNNPKYFLDRVSMTFHGRDIFAPVAAHLSMGVNLSEFGNEIQSIKKIDEIYFSNPIIKSECEIIFNIIDIDGFGNIITNISAETILKLIKKLKENIKKDEKFIYIKVYKGVDFDESKSLSISFPFKRTYDDVKKGEFLALIGSHGNLEFSQNQDNAAKHLKILPGDKLCLKLYGNLTSPKNI